MTATQLIHKHKFIHAYVGTPSSSTTPYVSLKNYGHLTVVIGVTNGSTVTGCAVTLNQATLVNGTGAKALAFKKVFSNVDLAASDTIAETAVTSNTFTTATTNSKKLLYVIEIDASNLDMDNNFDCVNVGIANAANTTLAVTYILSQARDAGNILVMPSAITD